MDSPPPANSQNPPEIGLMARWHATPLYLRILIACIVGALLGALLRELEPRAQSLPTWLRPLAFASALAVPSRLLLRLLGALAAPLVLVAVVQALMQAQIPKGSGV